MTDSPTALLTLSLHPIHIDWPAWLAAIGTVGAFFVLIEQVTAERNTRKSAERAARRQAERSQAESVSAWYAGEVATQGQQLSEVPLTRVALHNASVEPVYEAVVCLVFIQGAAPHTGEDWSRMEKGSTGPYRKVLGVIPPGRWSVTFDGGWGAMTARPGAEVAFTDRAGLHWVRRSRGRLEQLSCDAVEHYGIDRPIDYQVVELPL
jgi:hypothetical protein